ncbi:MAG: hypothetical protein US50_C0008G0011 [Candidatus Nomurabacteria bacterium GW2011_GWB1_37_5]|uniref:Uncharacterized protein n=1 Tax=Candidatus Nomurabacteria bacterium GW2011_GWB1_37_5 TaxID=1618742 RepID=A0A0G0HAY5_9BACT|nr:MAG: hypothetical protein US50_C0008G0011 [Candidatus Nomurabacteria bacterium GW2011_GWB1_37_5]
MEVEPQSFTFSGRGRSSDSAESCRAVSIGARPEVRPLGVNPGVEENFNFDYPDK